MNDYNQPVDFYDKLYFSKSNNLLSQFHKKRINGIVSLVPFKSKVLDLGCSSGLISNLLSLKKCDVVGVDIRKEGIEYAQLNSKALFINKNILELNLKTQFDVVLCTDVIEHFNIPKRKKIAEIIKAHLKNNGFVVITVPSVLEIILEPIWKFFRRKKYVGITFDDEKIHSLVLLNEIRRLFSGYKIVEKGFFCAFLTRYFVLKKGSA